MFLNSSVVQSIFEDNICPEIEFRSVSSGDLERFRTEALNKGGICITNIDGLDNNECIIKYNSRSRVSQIKTVVCYVNNIKCLEVEESLRAYDTCDTPFESKTIYKLRFRDTIKVVGNSLYNLFRYTIFNILDLRNLDISEVTDFEYFIADITADEIIIDNWKFNAKANLMAMLSATEVEYLTISNTTISKEIYTECMFLDTKIKHLKLYNVHIDKDLNDMFHSTFIDDLQSDDKEQSDEITKAANSAHDSYSGIKRDEDCFMLETERLIIRPVDIRDTDALHNECLSDKRVTECNLWDTYNEITATRLDIAWADNEYNFAIVLKDDIMDRPIGKIEAKKVYHHYTSAEIRYILSYEHINKGVMTEALNAVIQYLFRIGFNRVTAKHCKDNKASGKVLQKVGMKYVSDITCKLNDKEIITSQYEMIKDTRNDELVEN